MKVATLATLSLVLAVTVIPSNAQFLPPDNQLLQQPDLVSNLFGLRHCPGPYALCEASICRPTGRMISVNVAGSQTQAQYPEAECVCPIFPGPAIADVNGGNMQGNCDPPGQNQVWSLYSPKDHVPQEINNWSRRPADSLVAMQLCPSRLGLGKAFANCFNFSCTIDEHPRNGVRTATCHCPLGEKQDGGPIDLDTAFVTPAGQCHPDVCGEYPVGDAAPYANGQGWQCLGPPHNSD